MKIRQVSQTDSSLLVLLEGDFDALACKTTQADFDQISQADSSDLVLLDLGDVTFIDSSGVGAIVSLYKRLLVSNRDLEIINVNGQPKKLLGLLRIGNAIPVHPAANAHPE